MNNNTTKSNSFKKCIFITFMTGVPLSILGVVLGILATHQEGILPFVVEILLLPFFITALFGLSAANKMIWIFVVVTLQFFYYLCIVCIIRYALQYLRSKRSA